MKNKKVFKIVFVFFAIINFPVIFVDSIIFYDPSPTISTDKTMYYPHETITLSSSWNIYFSDSENISISIFLVNSNPNFYYTIEDYRNNNLMEIECTPNNGNSQRIDYIQTDFIFNNSQYSFPNTFWFVLVFFDYYNGQYRIDQEYQCNFTLDKFIPEIETNCSVSENYVFFNDSVNYFFIFKSPYPFQGLLKTAPIKVSIFSINFSQEFILFSDNDGVIYLNSKNLTNNLLGSFSVNITNLENFYFHSKTFNYSLFVNPQKISLLSLNNSNLLLNSKINNFDIYFIAKDNNNNNFYLNQELIFNIFINSTLTTNFSIQNYFLIIHISNRFKMSDLLNISINAYQYGYYIEYNQSFKIYNILNELKLQINHIDQGDYVEFLIKSDSYFTSEEHWSDFDLLVFNTNRWENVNYSLINSSFNLCYIKTNWSNFLFVNKSLFSYLISVKYSQNFSTDIYSNNITIQNPHPLNISIDYNSVEDRYLLLNISVYDEYLSNKINNQDLRFFLKLKQNKSYFIFYCENGYVFNDQGLTLWISLDLLKNKLDSNNFTISSKITLEINSLNNSNYILLESNLIPINIILSSFFAANTTSNSSNKLLSNNLLNLFIIPIIIIIGVYIFKKKKLYTSKEKIIDLRKITF